MLYIVEQTIFKCIVDNKKNTLCLKHKGIYKPQAHSLIDIANELEVQ